MDSLTERLARLSPEQLAELMRRARGTGGEGAPGAIPRRPGAGPFPLSFAQQRLWFLLQLDPANTAYNMVGAARLDGALDVDALRRAIDRVVERHDALRSVIARQGGEWVQVVAERMPVALAVEALEAIPPGERDAAVEARVRREHARPFDLEAGPPLRATLLRLGPERHVLLLAMHHVTGDGWSRAVIVRELSALYTAFVTGGDAALPELPVRHADYAAWQRERLQGERLAAQLDYWREKLAGAPGALELPADRQRPPVQSFAGRTHRFRLPREAADALRALGRGEGATPFMVLLAAFKTLLARYTGEADLVVGTPVANRGRRETEGVVGFFANTLALRTDLSGDPAFREALRRVRDTAVGAYAHEELPFERLVEALHPRRDLSRNPAFQVMFLLDEAPLRPVRLAGLDLVPLEVDPGTSMFDLTLGIEAGDDGDTARIEYATALFDAPTIERMARHLCVLLRGIAADPDARLSALPLAPAHERALLAEWNAAGRERPAGGCVHELFAAQAARTPDAVALVCGGEPLRYAELDARANRLARHLRRRGVGPEARVGVCLERTPALVTALLAILKAGGAYVPLDPAYPRERLGWMVEDARIRLVLTHSALAGRLPGGVEAVALDTLGEPPASEPAEAPPGGVDPENLSHVIFTSGSTGRPKGVMIRHAATAALLHWMRGAMTDQERACVLGSTSVSFDVSVAEIFGTLCWGGTLVLVESALDLPSVAGTGVRSACLVPSAAAELLRSGAIPPTLRALNLAGEPLPPELARGLYALGTVEAVRNLYGPTEDTSYSTCARVPRGAGRVPIGRPLPGTRAQVLGAALRPAPIGVAGELYLAGAGLARGYEARPALTAESFVPDPQGPPGARMYRTRDRARWTAEGELEYLGRVDLQVKVRGFRIEPGEVEAALRAHPAVADAVAVARGDAPGDRRLVAYLVARDGADAPGPLELRTHLRGRLPEYMVPSAFVALPALPRTPSGKLDRSALPAPETPPAEEGYVAPRTPAEAALAGIFAEVLGVERVGAHDDFFAAGGHSLLAMRVVARVRDAWGAEVPVRALFEAPTVAALAPRLAALHHAGGPAAAPPLVPVARDGRPLPLSFAQQRLWFLHQLDPAGSAWHMQAGVRLCGALDVEALERSLGALVARHETLRTRFPAVDGDPVQVIDAPRPLALHRVDLRGVDAGKQDDAVRGAMEDEAARPFDLAAGPLLRVVLLRLGERDHALVVTLHHVIADGWSTGVLVREAAELYAAYTTGREPRLPPLAVQYADYAVWQRAWLAGGAADAQIDWWRGRLAGAPPVLELPTDRPRAAASTARGGTLPFVLSAETADALRALGRREGATLFMTLLAAWQLLLSRHGAGDDVPVGTPVAGRARVEVEGLIGFFVNTLVLRTDLSGDPAFRALLGRVRETALGAFAHQEIPFEALVEALAPERSAGRTPLFQVMFALQNHAREAVRLGGIGAEPLEPAPIAAKFDLSLSLAEEAGALAGSLTFRAELFDAATAGRLLERWRILLEGVAADPDAALSRVPLLGAGERRRLLETWNDTAAALPGPLLLHRLFEAQAARTPGAPAVLGGAEAWTYAELDARANQLARHLRRRGVGPDARVGVCLERGVEPIAAILATWKAGGAYLPLDPAHPAGRLLGLLDDAGARVVVTAGAAAERLEGFAGRVVRLDADAEAIGRERVDAPAVEAWPESLAYVVYTSGSTGRPRGVMVEHRSVANLAAALDRAVYAPRGAAAPPRVSVNGPVTFDTSVKQIVQLLRGAALCVVPEAARRDAAALGALLRAHAVEVLDCTPAQLRHLLQDGLLDAAGPALTDLLVAGEAIDPALWRELAALEGRRAWNLYGPTECTVDAALGRVAGERPVLGGPVANARLYVLGAAGEPVPAGVAGELYVGGAGVARGYAGRPGLTAGRFVPDPFAGTPGARLYRTGDRVRRTAAGALEYLGRTDFQVKVRGFRVEPGEVEAALETHPAVARAVVVARDDGGAGERRLVAYAVPRAEAGLPPASRLRAYLAERLPEYMVPAAVVALGALPLTANGKVDRRALPAPDAAADDPAAPASPAAEIVAGIFAQVLGIDRAGAHDDFFALGGHSLLATRLASRVRDALGVELPLRALFEAPTPAGVAAWVAASSPDQAGEEPPLARVRRDGPLPLSFAQQRLWFIDQLEPGSAAYNLPYAVRLRGALNVDALERGLAEVVRRHEALRTRFPGGEGDPVQVIDPPGPVTLATADLAAGPEPEEALRALCADEAERPFDLSAGPLLRGTLARLGDDDHALLLTLHHIVSDGWSTGVLVRELSALYTAFSRGEPSPLAELPLQYADYAAWQRARLSGPRLEAQLGWWRETLRDAPPLLEIPTDHPRPPVPDGRAGTVRFSFTPAQAGALRALARREGATLFMTLLAAWQLLLARYSGQDDVCVGTPVAGRTRLETEGLVGLFVNTLALRTRVAGAPTFRDLLRRVREVTLGAFQHQELPFERLVEALVQGRALGHAPLFQAMLILQNNAREALRLGSLEARVLESAAAAAKFDLMLVVLEDGERLDGELTYRADLFEPHTPRRMVEHLCVLLDEMAADPLQPAARVELLRGDERTRVLEAWNRTDAAYAADRLIHHVIAEQAARTPGSAAVVFGDEVLTYAGLDERANRLAHALARRGARPGARVGICLERGAEMVVAVLGVLKSGAAYVPLDAAYPPARLAYMLEDSAAQLLVTQPSLRERLPAGRVPLVPVDGEPGGDDEDGAAAPASSAHAEDAAYVIYTSGSTGLPKGVQVTHANVAALFSGMDGLLGTGPGTWLTQSRLGFDMHVVELLWTLARGFRVVVLPEARDGRTVAALVERHGVTHLQCTPTLAALVLADAGPAALDGIRRLLLGGEGMPPELAAQVAARLPGALVNLYGPTEATVWCAAHPVERVDGPVPVGRPLANARVYVLDAALRPQPAGVPGELCIAGRGVSRGYLGRAALTADRFVPDPFARTPGARLYRTGDRGRWRADGTLESLGRMDQQVKIRGFRIETGEVESVLRARAGVAECVVLAREDVPGETRLVAYVAGPAAADAAGMRAYLRERLPEYMVPAAFVALARLPLTPNGKLDRRALPAPGPAPGEAAYDAPRTATEEILAGIFAEVLGAGEVGVRDDFFERGGHSLLATRVATRARAALGADLPLRVLFQEPTVAGLAAWIDARRGGAAPDEPLERVAEPGVWLPLSFAQQRLWVVSRLDPDSRVYNQSLGFRLKGRLDVAALGRALDLLVRRHAVFRTRFEERDGVPGQVIEPARAVPLPVEDLSGAPDPEAALAERVRAQARELFDLGSGTLFRALLLRLSPGEHVLAAAMHHITHDGWSAGILARELAQAYAAYAGGRDPDLLPDPPLQYADYAVWQRRRLTPERERAQLDYWRAQLRGLPRLRLSTDLARAAAGTDGDTQRFELSPELSAGVRALGRALGATPFMTLLAAFAALLHWQGGGDEVVLGTDVANRNLRAETEGLVGFFVNQLVLRTRLDGNPSFGELVARVRETTLAACDHQDVPFDHVVEALQPPRAPGETPFFRAKLVLQNAPAAAAAELPGVVLEPLPPDRSAAQLDVLLALHDRGERMTGLFEYRTALFSRELIGRWIRRFTTVLQAAVDDPSLTMGALKARLDTDERRERESAQDALRARRRARFAR